MVINDGRPTRYDIARNTSSHLDLTIVSPSLARIGEWNVFNTNNLRSDHSPILSGFGGELRREEGERVPRYNFARAEWDKFQEKAKSLVGEVDSDGSVDKWNDNITAMIHNAANGTIPEKQEPGAQKSVPWWNKRCDEAVRSRNRAYRK